MEPQQLILPLIPIFSHKLEISTEFLSSAVYKLLQLRDLHNIVKFEFLSPKEL